MSQPNVVLILVDDLGYGDLSCYGAKDMRTPHVDAIADAGTRFTQFYANCPVCSPTRASVLTGCYPDRVGVPGVIRTHRRNSWGHLSREAVLLPSLLKKAGYHCTIVGKWHLGLTSPNTPREKGFDAFQGFLGDMMDDYYNHRRHGINYMRHNEEEIDPEGHATDLFTQWAVDTIHERAKKKKPFFLYLAYNAPHTPIQPPEEWLERVKEREPGIEEKRAKLVALIEHMDDGVGQVMSAIEEAGIGDNTLLIFVSDNGGQLNVGANNGPLRDGKGDTFEGGIRVPFVARWKGEIPAGLERNDVSLTMDLLPTICEACGMDVPHKVDGTSILPALKGEPQKEERFLFWVRREGGPRYGGRDYYAGRYGQWKLLQNTPFEELKLYDLEEDPLEKNPLGEDHFMYRKLFQALQDHVNEMGVAPWQREEES